MNLVLCGTLARTEDKDARVPFYQEFSSYRAPEEYAWRIEELNKEFPYSKLMFFNEKNALLKTEGTLRLFLHAFEGLDGELEVTVDLCWSEDDIQQCLADADTIGGYYKILTLGELDVL